MKCKHCGADVTLDDHYCPNCGRPVEQAIRHQREMEQYEEEFEQTKKQAIEKVSVAGGGGPAVGIRLAVIVALVIILIAIPLNLNSYTINERRENRAAKKNHDAYVEQIETYLDNRDYVELSTFCDKHNLRFNDGFKQYRYIINGADYFKNIYKGIVEAAYCKEDTRYMYSLETLSRNVNSFYELIGRDYTYSENAEREQQVYGEMEEEMHVFLRRYFGLSRKDTDSMKEMSKSERTVMIEQALDARIKKITGKGLNEITGTELPSLEQPQGETK